MTISSEDIAELKNIATRLRIWSINSTNASKSGHPTSCSSCAEIISVLFFKTMHFDPKDPRNPNNDRFVLSKGHAAPVLYAAWSELGVIERADLLNLRLITSDLEGHPTPRLPFVDVATGSLGQGLSCAAGMAWVAKNVDRAPYRVFCLLGDGETAEGSIWEALSFAANQRLDNLIVVVDVNRLGQSQATALQHDLATYAARSEAFGAACLQLADGHDVQALWTALNTPIDQHPDRPLVILAKTFKGHAFSQVADREGFHGTALLAIDANTNANILTELRAQLPRGDLIGSAGGDQPAVEAARTHLTPPGPRSPGQLSVCAPPGLANPVQLTSPPNYTQPASTRAAFGAALAKLGESCVRVISLDGDTKNSTMAMRLAEKRPHQFIECFIAEQNMVGVAVGAACRSRTVPFVSAFACFLSRAADQIRMAAVCQSTVNFVGTHVGVSIGEDGPSQMGLEDLALFRAVPDCTVFYPSDAVAMERAVELAANQNGICYLRAGRPNQPIIYSSEEVFQIGKAKVIRSHPEAKAAIVTAGVTLNEAVKAADMLRTKSGIEVTIVDLFTVKPVDKEGIVAAVRASGGRLLTVEDHYPEGGLGEAVLSSLAGQRDIVVKQVAVRGVPRSGKPHELLAKFGLDAVSIVGHVEALLAM